MKAVPESERLSWTAKEIAARAHVAVVATPEHSALLLAEAGFVGETVDDLAVLIIAKADSYRAIAARFTGLRRKTFLALEAVLDPDGYEAVLRDAKAQAAVLAQELGLSL